jgi:coproporphyrinogen III oxidase
MPLRRSFAQLSPRTTRIAGRNAGSSVRGYATENSSRPKQQFTVWRPYLRLAVGVPFIGMIIYSMVSFIPLEEPIATKQVYV